MDTFHSEGTASSVNGLPQVEDLIDDNNIQKLMFWHWTFVGR